MKASTFQFNEKKKKIYEAALSKTKLEAKEWEQTKKALTHSLIRLTIGFILIYNVYFETGIWTVVIFSLLLINSELDKWAFVYINRYLKES